MSNTSSRSANSKKSHNKNNSVSSYSCGSRNRNDNSEIKNRNENNQSARGVAWGASGRISLSRSSFRSSPFSDFGSYMSVKNQKLHNQFSAEASNSCRKNLSSDKLIFKGVSIFVDGYTIPSSQVLRGYMLKYGGRFENYFSRRIVTHIICSNLPGSKIKNLSSFSGGLPVVKPTWLLDSISANKLLNWAPYHLDQIAKDAQPKLSSFFPMKRKHNIEDEKTSEELDIELMAQSTGNSDNSMNDQNDDIQNTEHMKNDLSQHTGHYNDGSDGILCENEGENDGTVNMVRSNQCCMASKEGEKNNTGAGNGLQSSKIQSSTSFSSHYMGNQNAEDCEPTCGSFLHSFAGDPSFVENYFKNSRLHFIGTWRNRYRKRFPCSSTFSKIPTDKESDFSNLEKSTIMHIDMDCFFVSVVVRNRPELQALPVAVCHSDNPRGTAEISSANYIARKYGVKAGIFVRDAKAQCPNLVIVPYHFEAYEEVADKLYNILHKHCMKVQAVSCDEAFLEFGNEAKDPEILASTIRKEIFDITGCTASAGISGNMLMARLATRTAKPNGQLYIPPDKVDDYLSELQIKELPGIGRSLGDKLEKFNFQTCGQLRVISKESLKKDFGVKTGEMLWNYSRGIDNRMVGEFQENKSLGAEVNWGVRLKDLEDCRKFVKSLCNEVSLRLQGCGIQGRHFTLKIKKRKKDAAEPAKFMGCGDCENLSHSLTVPEVTDDAEVLARISMQLFSNFNVAVKDIRGIGLQVSKLESTDIGKQRNAKGTLKFWFSGAPSNSTLKCEDGGRNLSNQDACSNQSSSLPPLSDLDLDVIESLPPEFVEEINEAYQGQLLLLVSEHKTKSCVGEGSHFYVIDKVEKDKLKDNIDGTSTSFVEPSDVRRNCSERPDASVMPMSLSQIDASVLVQLPEEVKLDILNLIPAHGEVNNSSDGLPSTENYRKLLSKKEGGNMFAGLPPYWVSEFKFSKCRVLNSIADIYDKMADLKFIFSSVLQSLLYQLHCGIVSDVASSDDSDGDVILLYEFLKQYTNEKLESDLEEIYLCFRLLKRLSLKSGFFLQVCDAVSSYIQASVGDFYGGTLHFPHIKETNL